MKGTSEEERGIDRDALERLYVKLETPMYNVVYRWVWSAEEAQDIVQEAFVRVWKARDRVIVGTAPALLYKTALRLASNTRRKRRVWGWLGLDTTPEPASRAPLADAALAAAEREAKVRAAVEALPEALREIVFLTEHSELSYAEIGELLGIPSGTVGSRRNLAIKKLKDALGDWELA